MILGIGTDIIEIQRIEEAINKNDRFLKKLFTEKENEYFNKRNFKPETVAGNFAAKEAISKALGTGFRGFKLADIEVLRDALGKPIVTLSEKVEKNFNLNKYIVNVSISHNKSSVVAFAIIEVI